MTAGATTHERYPDPSEMTTDSIAREVSVINRDLDRMRAELQRDLDQRANVRMREQEAQDAIFAAKLDAIQREFDSKMAAIDAAAAIETAAIKAWPDNIDRAIGHHEDLQLERFRSIDKQFQERDIRTEQSQKAGTEALAAALQAAKELVTAQGEASAAAAIKSETSFTKQIDQIGTIISTLEKALDARITELKERIDRGEGNNAGSDRAENKAQDQANALLLAAVNDANTKRQQSSHQLAILVAVLAVVALIVPLFTSLLNR